jgi:hypothetical protein
MILTLGSLWKFGLSLCTFSLFHSSF